MGSTVTVFDDLSLSPEFYNLVCTSSTFLCVLHILYTPQCVKSQCRTKSGGQSVESRMRTLAYHQW